MRRRLAIPALTLLAVAGLAAPAQAQLSVSSFSLTPSTTQAAANPNVTLSERFSSTDGDTPKKATISLAPGILANASAASVCDNASLQGDSCPGSSQIGQGTVTGIAFGFTLPLPAAIYRVAPQGSELARIGIIVNFFDTPVTITAPVVVRTSPDVGLDIPIDNIPNSISGGSVRIIALSLTLEGTVNDHRFTRNPSSCTAANTHLVVVSYGDPSHPASADSSFTPSGCDTLPYAPKLAATATPDSGENGVAFGATITQGADEAATKQVKITLPPALAPRLSALSAACSSSDLSTCPAVGSATVDSPLLPASIQGKLVIATGGGSQQGLDVVFGPPLNLVFQGTPTIGGGNLSATFTGLPDVPITNLKVSFAGGPNSLLSVSGSLCGGAQNVLGELTGYNGASAHPTAALDSSSCHAAGKAPTASIKLHGHKHPKLTVTASAGQGAPALKSITIKLPGSLHIVKSKLPHGVSATLDGKAAGRSSTNSNRHSLTFSLGGGGRSVEIRLNGPSLVASPKLRRHKLHRLTVLVTLTDASGKQTQLTLTQLL